MCEWWFGIYLLSMMFGGPVPLAASVDKYASADEAMTAGKAWIAQGAYIGEMVFGEGSTIIVTPVPGRGCPEFDQHNDVPKIK